MVELPTCHYFGPHIGPKYHADVHIPDDWSGDPYEYLPETIIQSESEKQLAKQYVAGDMSGGYFTSQAAHFRSPKSPESHSDRRQRFASLATLAAGRGLRIPRTLQRFANDDKANNRVRHDTIWFHPFDALVPFPADSTCFLAPLFYEGQGCAFWYLMLSTNSGHQMVFCEESLGVQGEYPGGHEPDIALFTFYSCADTFDEWLAFYFRDCIAGDLKREANLERFKGL